MSALGDTQARIESIRKLRTVVGAMRGIAAAHAEQARSLLPGFRAYAEVVAGGLGRALSLLDADPAGAGAAAKGPEALVLFTAEHGFAGAFSARVLDAVGEPADAALFVLGARGASLAQQRGWPLAWTAPAASQASGVADAARQIAAVLYSGFVRDGFARAEIVYAVAARSGADVEIVRRRILPIEPSAFRAPRPGPPPLVNLPPRRLVEQLVGEHVFAELALAALESFAGENAARLATMESARLNIDQKLEQLTSQEQLLRQDQITAEVEDVAAGALAAEARR